MRQPAILIAVLGSLLAHAALLAGVQTVLTPEAPQATLALQLKVRTIRELVHAAPLTGASAQTVVRRTGAPDAARKREEGKGEVVFWPPDSLERQPVPVSAPDVQNLAGQAMPSGLMRLRLFIDASGLVRNVALQGADGEAWSDVLRMFKATRFIPGQRGGQNVASWVEIEVDISDLVRVL